MDEIIWEEDNENRETYKNFPILKTRIESFILNALLNLIPLQTEDLIQQRYQKYRKLGTFSILDSSERQQSIQQAKQASVKPSSVVKSSSSVPSLFCKKLGEDIVLGERSKWLGKAPAAMSIPLLLPTVLPPPIQKTSEVIDAPTEKSAKAILGEMIFTTHCFNIYI